MNLSSPEKVVIGGASAGGIATYFWINRIYKSNLWNTSNTLIGAMPDSGFFLNYENV